ncbi:MAG: cyclic nucleotide-binding domain-containing protein [Ignavibacteriales bacterium]|nr:cyclic nucleotide-binding domain-containing protein [Ignavibacteriales bacterium]MCF8435482.1 cyclic nucleotide-binding domain-containing protein [Ignavibacteriales bacterium]
MPGKSKVLKSNFWANLFRSQNNRSDIESVLTAMPPFENMDRKHLKLFMQIIHNRVYSASEYVFYQGDPGVCLYIILSGEITVHQNDELGNSFELARFTRGDFFGELALIDEETRSATAQATKETTIAAIFKPDLDEFMEKYPTEGIKILGGISKIIAMRLRRVNNDYISLYNNIFNSKEV